MKSVFIAVVLAAACCSASFAADQTAPPQEQGRMTVEQKKAEITRHIEERIANSQREKACVQAAQSHDELQTCREKYRPQHPQQDRERRDRNRQGN